MITLADPGKPMDLGLLNQQLEALSLPNFTGTSFLQGNRTADSQPHLFIKCGALSSAALAAVQQVVADHTAPTPSTPEDYQATWAAASTDAAKFGVLARHAGLV
jgi:hypothetical protein